MNKLGKLTLGASSLLATVAFYGINAHADVKVPTDVPTGSQKAVMTTQQPYADGLQTAENISSRGGESEQGTSSNLVVNGNDGNIIGLNESKVVDSGISDEQATKYFNNSVNKNVVKTRVGWALQSDVDKYKLAESTEMRLTGRFPNNVDVTSDWPDGDIDYSHSNIFLTSRVNTSDLAVGQKLFLGTLILGSDVDISDQSVYLEGGGITNSFDIRDSKSRLLGRAHFEVDEAGLSVPDSESGHGTILDFFLDVDYLTDVKRTGLITVSSDFQNVPMGVYWRERNYRKRNQLQGHAFYFGYGNNVFITRVNIDKSPIKYNNNTGDLFYKLSF